MAKEYVDTISFDEEEDAYGTYYRTKKTKENASKETERRRAAASATFRAASARDKEAQRVLDEAMRRDAEWRARVANETNETKKTKSGKRPRENDVKNVSFCSDASSYRRAWGVVAAMADRGELIEHDDLPWPTREGDAASAEDARRAILGENLADTSPAPKSARAVLRLEMLRWHPDKFDAKMGGFIVEADRERVRARVNVVARIIAQLFQEAR